VSRKRKTMGKDYYTVLGVSHGADDKELKAGA